MSLPAPEEIVAKLRALPQKLRRTPVPLSEHIQLLQQAADEIERLKRLMDGKTFVTDNEGAIDQLHAAVKTAQELAATRLQEIERLRAENLTLRNAAVNLHEKISPPTPPPPLVEAGQRDELGVLV